MSWNYDRSLERISDHLDNLGEITIEKLKREADLDNLLSETNCREIFGAHVYAQLAGLAPRASDTDLSDQDFKRLIQATQRPMCISGKSAESSKEQSSTACGSTFKAQSCTRCSIARSTMTKRSLPKRFSFSSC